ncbi:hypothetical protein cypCar_00031474 [Cyprinus carpio]|nr:hypothetical protein cypCar_00031474 [Cyprinus carpio]
MREIELAEYKEAARWQDTLLYSSREGPATRARRGCSIAQAESLWTSATPIHSCFKPGTSTDRKVRTTAATCRRLLSPPPSADSSTELSTTGKIPTSLRHNEEGSSAQNT